MRRLGIAFAMLLAFPAATYAQAPWQWGPVPVSGFPINLPRTAFLGPDGSTQFVIFPNPAATEYWQVLGGVATDGATMFSTNGSTGAVNGNFVAQETGSFWFGNGIAGGTLNIQPSLVFTTRHVTALVASGDMALVTGSSRSLTMDIPDAASTGGNARGANAVDMQSVRNGATQVASATASFIGGGSNNLVSGQNSGGVAGFGNVITGQYSGYVGGIDGADDGRYGTRIYGTGFLAAIGDRQLSETVLSGVSTASASVRLTGNAATASSTTKNCVNLPTGKAGAYRFSLVGTDFTTPAKHVGYFVNFLMFREIAGTMGIAVGAPETIGTDTATVSLTADGTLFCLNATVTADNADTWHWNATVYGSEVK